jgi:hypothetical protein
VLKHDKNAVLHPLQSAGQCFWKWWKCIMHIQGFR